MTPLCTEDIMPHAPPTLALDEILAYDEDRLEATVHLAEPLPFLRHGRARGALAIELIAQGVAAHVGTRDRHLGYEVRRGYVVAIREADLGAAFFHEGDRLEVAVQRTGGDERTCTYRGTVRREGASVAHASLTIHREELPSEGGTRAARTPTG